MNISAKVDAFTPEEAAAVAAGEAFVPVESVTSEPRK
jgi:hypothetical protein